MDAWQVFAQDYVALARKHGFTFDLQWADDGEGYVDNMSGIIGLGKDEKRLWKFLACFGVYPTMEEVTQGRAQD